MTETTAGTPLLGVTMGDPAGIGPEVIVKGYREATTVATPVVIGDAAVCRAAIECCDLTEQPDVDTHETKERDLAVRVVDRPGEATDDPTVLDVLDLDNVDIEELERGVVAEATGRASLEYVERAIELALDGAIDAITTAPINKQSTNLAGSTHAGHTGLLAERTDTDAFSMMLLEGPLRVTHVSTHVPLAEACDLVTTDRVFETIRVTDEALRELGETAPTVAVAGLNPHAGDGGILGSTEAEAIAPAIERSRANGIDATGPISPDTVYVRAANGEFDCVVSMYHDQGHIPIKMLGFSTGDAVSGVNVTIGLPIVRTSVDHGTAFDIAGDGIASEASFVEAVEIAAEMADRRGPSRGDNCNCTDGRSSGDSSTVSEGGRR